MKNRVFSWILVAAVAVLAVLGGVYFVNRNLSTPAHTIKGFSGSYIAGYEGYFSWVSYTISYPSDVFTVSSSPNAGSRFSLVNLKDSGISSIRIFSNEAAGFSSSRELFQSQNLCASCREIPLGSALKNATDSVAFTDGSRTWIVFAGGPGFVIADLAEPSVDAQDVLATLKFSSLITNQPGGGTTFKVYFFNENIRPVKECNEVVTVMRSVPKTAQVGTTALNVLLAGPLPTEEYGGYYSVIPYGSRLNSLTISNGVAYADFNATAESGGGSCSMRARTTQIRKTLLQFPTVKHVVLSINGATSTAFQP